MIGTTIFLLGSTDNISALMVTLPASIQQTKEDVKKEEELEAELIKLIDIFLEGTIQLIKALS